MGRPAAPCNSATRAIDRAGAGPGPEGMADGGVKPRRDDDGATRTRPGAASAVSDKRSVAAYPREDRHASHGARHPWDADLQTIRRLRYSARLTMATLLSSAGYGPSEDRLYQDRLCRSQHPIVTR